jgi:hypothetical protein
MIRYSEGKATRLPTRVLYHVVAARYGTTPEAVRGWPADDFLDACWMLLVPGNGR